MAGLPCVIIGLSMPVRNILENTRKQKITSMAKSRKSRKIEYKAGSVHELLLVKYRKNRLEH